MFCFLDLFVTGITKHLLVESSYFISNLNSPRTPANCISISRPPQNAFKVQSQVADSDLKANSKLSKCCLAAGSRAPRHQEGVSGEPALPRPLRSCPRPLSTQLQQIVPGPHLAASSSFLAAAILHSRFLLSPVRRPFPPGCRQSDVPSTTFSWPWSCGDRLPVLLD